MFSPLIVSIHRKQKIMTMTELKLQVLSNFLKEKLIEEGMMTMPNSLFTKKRKA